MPFQFLAPVAPYVNPVLKLAGTAALVDQLMKLSNIKIGITPINDQAPPPPTLAGAFGKLGTRLFNKNMTERISDYDKHQGAGLDMEKIRQLGLISDYDKHQGAGLDMDEIRRLGLLYQNVSTPTPTPVVVPVIEGMSEWEAAKKAQDMALADQLGMEIWARENPGLAAAVAERARIRGTNQTDNPLMRDFRSQLPSPTNSTATTGIPATPGFQSLLENLEKIAKADDGTSLVAPEKPIDPKILLKNKGEPVEPFRN